ncbi:MAG: hypothetical protein J6334_05135, partial [Kiritimatiellae bacterium]|nr:hypothetical protein [Kiritimatiellia bacterium]
MNKQEKLFALLLGLALVGWIFYSSSTQAKERARLAAQKAAGEAAAENAAPAPAPTPPRDTAISASPEQPTPFP